MSLEKAEKRYQKAFEANQETQAELLAAVEELDEARRWEEAKRAVQFNDGDQEDESQVRLMKLQADRRREEKKILRERAGAENLGLGEAVGGLV